MKYLIPLFFLLASCSAGYHIKRAIKKDPTILQADTVSVVDTVQIVTEQIERDTVFKLSETHDTLIIKEDKLTIKHYYNRITDSVFISGECESDTIIQVREIKVPFEKIVYHEDNSKSWWTPLIVVVCIVILLILIRLFRRS